MMCEVIVIRMANDVVETVEMKLFWQEARSKVAAQSEFT